MTALDRQLVTTFRAARWATTHGTPACPDCFDGADLAKPMPDRFTPELARYRCTVCCRNFRDVSGTPFKGRSPAPLVLLALLVLVPDPRRIEGLSPQEVSRHWGTAERIRRSDMAAAWKRELVHAKITPARLTNALNAQRRAA